MDKIKRKRNFSRFLITGGVVCILSSAFIVGNIFYKNYRGYMLSKDALDKLESKVVVDSDANRTEGRMPVVSVDGVNYVGVVKIPRFSLSLPVKDDWSDSLLNSSPCRYTGSIYEDSMVVMGHNFRTHFGPIGNLKVGDEVIFTDASGTDFLYLVASKEVLNEGDVDDMVFSDYDLTLFTCDLNRKKRVTIRCESL